MNIEINGGDIQSEGDFHSEIASALNFPHHYGRNLDALWDVLTTDVERPIVLIWRDASSSKSALAERFDLIVELLRKVEQQDLDWGLKEKFELKLR